MSSLNPRCPICGEDLHGDLKPLKKDLVAAINKVLRAGCVRAVYFKEFVTQ